jgi:hypothetical protein
MNVVTDHGWGNLLPRASFIKHAAWPHLPGMRDWDLRQFSFPRCAGTVVRAFVMICAPRVLGVITTAHGIVNGARLLFASIVANARHMICNGCMPSRVDGSGKRHVSFP